MYSLNSLIFRFPNVVGPRLTHGVIFDFINKLRKNPKELEILGNGLQNKQYVHVLDLVKGIASFSERIEDGMNIYNISTDSFIDVNKIADIVCEGMNLKDVQYRYTGGSVGWKGDVPSFSYDIKKAKSKGWMFKYDSEQSVRETVKAVLKE
jgi:UDP-glucose 4-epimerase